MAWTITTYAGAPAHGVPSNLRIAMFEIIRGINERADALGNPFNYTWWVTAASPNHLKASPTFDDLELLPCVGSLGSGTEGINRAYKNMALIIDRIKGQLNTARYRTTSGGSTVLTVAAVEASIGQALVYPIRVNDAAWWQGVKDALDLMIYASTNFQPQATENLRASATGSSSSNAWDNLPSPSVYTEFPAALVRWSTGLVSGSTWFAEERKTSEGFFHIAGISSSYTIIKGGFVSGIYSYSYQGTNYTGGTIDVDLMDNTITFGNTATTNGSVATGTLTLGATLEYTAEILTTRPSSMPFDGLVNVIALNITGMTIAHNLAPVLTDQA
jgi:hypothetical protein